MEIGQLNGGKRKSYSSKKNRVVLGNRKNTRLENWRFIL